jgi:competence protein ComEA
MFNLKSFISLAFAAFFAVLFLQASLAHAEDPNPAVASAQQININTADAEAIASALKGIGLKKAQAIIEYRKTYGPFHDVEELTEVNGIGKSTLEKNAGVVVVK